MLTNLKTNKILWSVTTGLILVAAIFGVVLPHIYDGLFAMEFIPGALPQDILSILICLGLFFMISKVKEDSLKMQVIIFGIIASFFYLYGIFTIERVYNFLYILYAAIFAMSFWSILYALMHLKEEVFQNVKLSNAMIRISAISGIIIALLFTTLWISSLIPLMRQHNRIEYLYSIYILDLCFVMPAFFITAVMSLKKMGKGIALTPAIYILGVFVIFPLGLGEIVKPYYGQTTNVGSMMMSFLFSAYMLVIGLVQLKKIKIMEHS
jgi:hypothetical protein